MTDAAPAHLKSCFEEDTKDLFHTADFVIILTQLLVQMAKRGDQKSTRSRPLSRFYSNRPPTISVKRYLQRIFKYAPCSESCYILSLIYLERMSRLDPSFFVCSKSVHRLVITSIMVSTKFYDDGYYKNQHYAQVGGLTLPEINDLERDFLFRLQFSLGVDPHLHAEYKRELGRLITAYHDAAHFSPQRHTQPHSHSHSDSPSPSPSPLPSPSPSPSPTMTMTTSFSSVPPSPQTPRRLFADQHSLFSEMPSSSSSSSSSSLSSLQTNADETDYSSCSSSYSSTSSLDSLLPIYENPSHQQLGMNLAWTHLCAPPLKDVAGLDSLWAFHSTQGQGHGQGQSSRADQYAAAFTAPAKDNSNDAAWPALAALPNPRTSAVSDPPCLPPLFCPSSIWGYSAAAASSSHNHPSLKQQQQYHYNYFSAGAAATATTSSTQQQQQRNIWAYSSDSVSGF